MEYLSYALAGFLFLVGSTMILSVIRRVNPPLPSSPPIVTKVISILKENLKEGQSISEIGSGYGYLLFRMAKRFPDRKFTGYEIGLTPFLVSYFIKIVFRYKNVKLIYGNAFTRIRKNNIQIECAIAYLAPVKSIIMDMEDIYKNHITDTLILNTYPLETIEPISVTEKLDIFKSKVYLYKK